MSGKHFETCLKCQIWNVFLKNSHNNEIIDCHVVYVADQEILPEWKKMGLCSLLEKFRNIAVHIRYLTMEKNKRLQKDHLKTTKSPEYCLPIVPSIPYHIRLLKSQIKVKLPMRCTQYMNIFKRKTVNILQVHLGLPRHQRWMSLWQ